MANLRAVAPDEKPAKADPKSITAAIGTGRQRDILIATRNRIARTLDDPKCPPRDLAALTRRLDDVVEKLVALDQAAKQEADESGLVEDEAFDASAI